IGSALSSIFKLFGAGNATKMLPPLVAYRLPIPQSQTVYVSPTGSTTYDGTNVEKAAAPQAGTGIYTNSGQITTDNTSSNSSFVNQSAQIAQAVKNALLTSSSLNDVISEI
ncbi:MAG: hypothetical protein ACRD4O_11310, partial [Bryobacteraceae bacterium]